MPIALHLHFFILNELGLLLPPSKPHDYLSGTYLCGTNGREQPDSTSFPCLGCFQGRMSPSNEGEVACELCRVSVEKILVTPDIPMFSCDVGALAPSGAEALSTWSDE